MTVEKSHSATTRVLPQSWVLIAAFLVLAVPTALNLMTQTWSQESGAQGPIVLATGGWLLWRLIPQFRRLTSPSSPWLIAAALSVSLLSYVFGRVVDLITFEAAGLFGVGVTMLYAEVGFSALAKNWFPFSIWPLRYRRRPMLLPR